MHAVRHALSITGSMTWEITWALILGFLLSAIVQAVVRKSTVVRLLGDDRPRTLARAALLGSASSSCSYAAVALARSLFRKGADFTAAMAFEIASTNLVVELGVILALLMGWQFTAAEFVGGPIMIVLVALGFRVWMRGKIADAARAQADKGIAGSMEGHAAMDMSVTGHGSFWQRLFSRRGMVAVSEFFVMDWAAVIRDIAIGLLIAGAFAAWVPKEWLQAVFFVKDPTAAFILGPLIGPLLAMVSFIFADLIIIPIILIYRKYYGTAAAIRITAIFYGAMAIAGYLVELIFRPLGLVPTDRHRAITDASVTWNYTTWLNILFLCLAAALLIVFFRNGGGRMLRMMGGSPAGSHDDAHHHGASRDDASHEHSSEVRPTHDHASHARSGRSVKGSS